LSFESFALAQHQRRAAVNDEIAFAPRQFFGAALDLFERFLVSLFLPAATMQATAIKLTPSGTIL
jgi:hypothetical protein